MPSITKRTYADRAAVHPIPVAQQLLAVCDRKQTNLCVSVDVTSKQSLLRIADAAGPYCCCIKVHLPTPARIMRMGKLTKRVCRRISTLSRTLTATSSSNSRPSQTSTTF